MKALESFYNSLELMNSTLSKKISNQAIYFRIFLLEEQSKSFFSIETSSEFSVISIAKRILSNYLIKGVIVCFI